MTKRKKRNAITLASLLLALAALIGFYVWYSNKPADKDNNSSNKGTDNISLVKIDQAKVTQLHYTGGSGTDITFVLEDNVWKSQANPNRPISQDNVTSMLKLISKVTATRKIADSPDNLADYGLSQPYAYIQATLKDGSTVSLKLGDEAATGDGYYAMVNDNKTVYLVTVNYGSGLNYSDSDFTEKESTPTITAGNITYLSIEKRDGQDIELKANDSTTLDNSGSIANAWSYLKPYGAGYSADTTAVTNLQSNYTSFDLLNCVDYTGKDFDKYGLKDPAAVIDIKYYEAAQTASPTPSANSAAASSLKTKKEFKLYIGNKDDNDDYYVRIDGSDMVYTMGVSEVDKMLTVDTFSLLDTYANIPNINNVGSITADIAGSEYNMALTHKTTKNSSGEETKSTYSFNGTKANETAFKNLYQSMVSPKYDAELTDKVDTAALKPVMTLTFQLTGDYKSTVKTSFLSYNDSFYIADKGTGKYFLVDKRTIDDLAKSIETFNPASAEK